MQGHTQTTTELVSKFKYLFRNFTSVIKIKSWFQNHSFLFERVEVYLKTEFSALLLKQNISNWSWKGRKIFCFVSCFILFIKITQTHILTFSFYYFLTLLLSLPYHYTNYYIFTGCIMFYHSQYFIRWIVMKDIERVCKIRNCDNVLNVILILETVCSPDLFMIRWLENKESEKCVWIRQFSGNTKHKS